MRRSWAFITAFAILGLTGVAAVTGAVRTGNLGLPQRKSAAARR